MSALKAAVRLLLEVEMGSPEYSLEGSDRLTNSSARPWLGPLWDDKACFDSLIDLLNGGERSVSPFQLQSSALYSPGSVGSLW